MISFSNFLTEEKNTHMMHIENAVLYRGVKGTERALQALEDLYGMLSGSGLSQGRMITQKWDGAPAVFFGSAPDDGQFFVAKKGIFNKDPKVYKSIEDIKADTSGDLAEKLISVFNNFKDAGIKTIYQGDLMFTKKDVETSNIDGKKLYTFQANTIVYAVPVDSEPGKQIKSADLGIVVHTEYKGKSYEKLSATFDINVNSLKKKMAPKVWVQDAYIDNLGDQVTLDQDAQNQVRTYLDIANKTLRDAKGIIKQIEANQELATNIETFQNSFIRSDVKVTDAKRHVNDLIAWFDERFRKRRDKLKSDKGKAKVDVEQAELMKFFSDANKRDLQKLFELQFAMANAKDLLFRQLERIKSIGTFVRTPDGFRVTGTEGYVIVDKLDSKTYKIVDRMEFSKNNFSKDIIKSWMRDR
jgi:hypothetical protein